MADPRFTDPPEQDWHGWSTSAGPLSLHVGHMPGRKSACLYAVDGSVAWTLAYFRNDKEAKRAMAILDALILRAPP